MFHFIYNHGIRCISFQDSITIYAREVDFKMFRTKKKDRVLNLSFVSMIYTHMAMSYSMCSRHNPFAGAVFSSLGGTAGLFFSTFFAPAVAPSPSF